MLTTLRFPDIQITHPVPGTQKLLTAVICTVASQQPCQELFKSSFILARVEANTLVQGLTKVVFTQVTKNCMFVTDAIAI